MVVQTASITHRNAILVPGNAKGPKACDRCIFRIAIAFKAIGGRRRARIHAPSWVFPDQPHLLDDGSVRLYDLPATSVIRAIRGLGSKDASEVSSTRWTNSSTGGLGRLWVACGSRVGVSFILLAARSSKSFDTIGLYVRS